MSTLAVRLCRHLHTPEWDASTPRQKACADCVETAKAVTSRGPQMIGASGPVIFQTEVLPPRAVVVICANCGGPGGGRRMRA